MQMRLVALRYLVDDTLCRLTCRPCDMLADQRPLSRPSSAHPIVHALIRHCRYGREIGFKICSPEEPASPTYCCDVACACDVVKGIRIKEDQVRYHARCNGPHGIGDPQPLGRLPRSGGQSF